MRIRETRRFFPTSVQAQALLAIIPVLVDASFNVITGQIIGAAIEVHSTLGPGLLEST